MSAVPYLLGFIFYVVDLYVVSISFANSKDCLSQNKRCPMGQLKKQPKLGSFQCIKVELKKEEEEEYIKISKGN